MEPTRFDPAVSSAHLLAGLLVLVEQIPGVCWTTDSDLRFTNSLGRGLESIGLKPQQVVGLLISEFVDESESGVLTIESHRRALLGETITYEQTIFGRVFQSHLEPLRQNNKIIGVIGIAIDITERRAEQQRTREAHGELEARVHERTIELYDLNSALRQSEAHYREAAEFNRRLLMELDHRVRNNLAGLLSLVSLMRDAATPVGAFADAIDARLRGLAHVNHMLTECRWKGIDLRTLIASLIDSLTPAVCPALDVELTGEAVELSPHQTLPLAMILVEWLTNSCKYGAHSRPGGKLKIDWRQTDAAEASRLQLRWREEGGPRVVGTPRPSLGTQLVTGFATRELKGGVELRYPESGADHLLDIPLKD